MEHRIMLIVNPVAGKGKAASVLSGVLQELCRGGKAVTVYMTEFAGHGQKLAAEHGSEYDTVICMGGDGTLSRVVNGLMELPAEKRPTVGYIPLGTSNDMARTLGLSRIPKRTAKQLMEGSPMLLDIGRCTGGYFDYVAAFGIFTSIPFQTDQAKKNAVGWLAYLTQAAISLPEQTARHVKVEYDDGVIEGDFILGAVSNGTCVARVIRLNPDDAILNDGLLEVLLVRDPKTPIILNEEITSILSRRYTGDNVVLLHTSFVRFTAEEPLTWTRDGEDGGQHTVLEARVCPGALQILK